VAQLPSACRAPSGSSRHVPAVRGVEVDTQGEGFFVVFERASDAVAAAEAAQAADALVDTGV
jgi:class 3 adenylate cyclase